LLHPLGVLFASHIINQHAFHVWGMPLSLTMLFATFIAILCTTPAAYLTWRFVEAPENRNQPSSECRLLALLRHADRP
jgi:peptidoglycan/LPS O-acetylase OafA/YrhL